VRFFFYNFDNTKKKTFVRRKTEREARGLGGAAITDHAAPPALSATITDTNVVAEAVAVVPVIDVDAFNEKPDVEMVDAEVVVEPPLPPPPSS
jgi:hypothetical protein